MQRWICFIDRIKVPLNVKTSSPPLSLVVAAAVAEDNTKLKTEENYQMILQRKSMMDMAKMQAEDLLLLRTELERLRMKSFPALP